MRIWLVCIFVPIILFFNCKNSQDNKVVCDSCRDYKHQPAHYLGDRLHLYDVDSCLLDLLSKIIESNRKYFDPRKSFYSITLRNHDKYRYLRVQIDEWQAAKDVNYAGMIKLKGTTFLCIGDLNNTTLFKRKSGKPVPVKLKRAKENHEEMPLLVDPSLRGTFDSCSGLPIYVEVYTAEPISGFEMHGKP